MSCSPTFSYIAHFYFFDVTVSERSAIVCIVTSLGVNESTFMTFKTSFDVVDAHLEFYFDSQEKSG